MRLLWNSAAGNDGNGLGMADNGTKRVRLAGRPELGFDFDVIDYDTDLGTSSKAVDGSEAVPLTADELSAIGNFLGSLP